MKKSSLDQLFCFLSDAQHTRYVLLNVTPCLYCPYLAHTPSAWRDEFAVDDREVTGRQHTIPGTTVDNAQSLVILCNAYGALGHKR